MIKRSIVLNLGRLNLLIALLKLGNYLNAGSNVVQALLRSSCWTGSACRV
jgi:hypothetical protein